MIYKSQAQRVMQVQVAQHDRYSGCRCRLKTQKQWLQVQNQNSKQRSHDKQTDWYHYDTSDIRQLSNQNTEDRMARYKRQPDPKIVCILPLHITRSPV
jgi:hypothetical protein